MTKSESAIVRVLPWLPALITIVVTLQIRPYFGNMDDSRFVAAAGTSNPLAYAAGFFNPELGFIRSGSLIIVWPAAWLGYHLGADAYFIMNIVVVTVCVAAFGFIYGRVAGWNNKWLFVAFMGAAFAWPYTAEMFFFPSLSEKGIILGGAALLLGVWALNRVESPWIKTTLVFLSTLFAFSTKTQILLLVPGAVVMLWATRQQQDSKANDALRLITTLLWAGCSIGVIALARLGSYTSATQGQMGSDFIKDRRFLLLVGILGAYAAAVLWRLFRKNFHATDLVPIAYLFAAALAFPIWEIRNYYLAIASAGVATAVVTVLTWCHGKTVTVVAILSVTMASAWLIYRLPMVFESLASVQQFLESDTAQLLSVNGATFGVSCIEAPVHYNTYAERLNVSSIDFTFSDESSVSTIDYVFADSRLCPWPGTISREEWAPLWTSTFGPDAFTLFSR